MGGLDEKVRQTAGAAVFPQAADQPLQVRLVALEEARGDGDLRELAVLAVLEGEVADDRRLYLLRAEHLDDDDLVAALEQPLERARVALLVEEVGDDDLHSRRVVAQRELFQPLVQVGGPLRLDRIDELEKPPHLLLAPGRGKALEARAVRRLDRDAVEIRERDIGHRGRQPLGVEELRRIAVRHRQAAVDEDGKPQVLLDVEELEEEAVESAVDVPVDVAQVVALRIVAVVGEFRARAAPFRPLLALGAPGKKPAHDQLEMVELRDQRSVEERAFLHAVATAAFRSGVTCPRISSMTFSILIPSASPSKLSRMRWRSAACAAAFTSWKSALKRPSIRAATLEARTIDCAPRGLEPKRTNFRTLSGASSDSGCVAQTRRDT